MEGHLLIRARSHAVKRGISLDQLVSELVEHELDLDTTARTRAMFDLADQMNAQALHGSMGREETHSRG